VGAKQANWAEYLLHRHGIPVKSRPVRTRNQAFNPGAPLPPPAQAQRGPLDTITDFLFK
jgi:hypothetical protein